MRKQAFTLAEVLITLAIIGVVAAMTIPTLMSNTGKSEFKTGFKKILSTMNQAVTMSVALDYTDFADTSTTDPTKKGSVYRILSDRMHIVKSMDKSANGLETSTMGFADSNYTLFFSDGMVLSYPKSMMSCTFSRARTNCKAIVDVNGTKMPNKLSHCQYNAATGGSSTITSDNKTGNGTGQQGDSTEGVCSEANAYIADQYSVIFRGQQVLPNGYAARYVLYDN